MYCIELRKSQKDRHLVMISVTLGECQSFNVTFILPCFIPGLVFPGDILLCLTNKKKHRITGSTSVEYIKKKIMGAPGTVCKLTLQREGVPFDVDLRRGGFSQPAVAGAAVAAETSFQSSETALSAVDQGRASTRSTSPRSRTSRRSAALLHTCGVGLLVGKDAKGNIVIEGIAPGGPADASGKVLRGDIILG